MKYDIIIIRANIKGTKKTGIHVRFKYIPMGTYIIINKSVTYNMVLNILYLQLFFSKTNFVIKNIVEREIYISNILILLFSPLKIVSRAPPNEL